MSEDEEFRRLVDALVATGRHLIAHSGVAADLSNPSATAFIITDADWHRLFNDIAAIDSFRRREAKK